jgi:nucleotide-binding universal stress UspA family protein|tara:strand:- start:1854 stop:2648 length:795 start_codon:yes stop_codon:yes gene_type:complete
MKHILVPVGSTENASNTLQYAIDFAAKFDAKVFVFRAYNFQTKAGTIINIDSIIERETNLYMRSVVNSVNRKNVEIKLISAKGSVLDTIDSIDNELGIDLIIVGPKSNSIKDEVFLGRTTGSIVKRTEIPVLIIPNGYVYQPVKSILTAFKSGIINKRKTLKPLQAFASIFDAEVNLLLVKTPNHTDEDLVLNSDLETLKTTLTVTESATTYQGVLSNMKLMNPDLLCVFRRKRGFFKKLWEKNVILKEEFYCNVPLLILRGKL